MRGQAEANGTLMDVTLYTDYSIGKALSLRVGKVKHGKGISCRGLYTDTGNFSEFFNKSLYG